MKKTAIFLAPGFEEGEALTVADILRRAGIGCDLVGFSPVVEGAHQMKVQCDRVLDDIPADQVRDAAGGFADRVGRERPELTAEVQRTGNLSGVAIETIRGDWEQYKKERPSAARDGAAD